MSIIKRVIPSASPAALRGYCPCQSTRCVKSVSRNLVVAFNEQKPLVNGKQKMGRGKEEGTERREAVVVRELKKDKRWSEK